MVKRYLFEDPALKSIVKYPDLIIDGSNPILTVFRLITGSVNCRDLFNEKAFLFRYNYSDFPFRKISRINQKSISGNFPDDVKLKDLNTYFKTSKLNKDFYGSIECELINCLISEKRSLYLQSFCYLYRLIEGIAYSIPLIYVSKNKSFDKTYKDLKAFFGKEKDGELAFFKAFVISTFKEEDFFKSTIDIDLAEVEIEEMQQRYHDLYINKMKRDAIKDDSGQVIKVSFIGFYEFLIELRNRFFHFSKGSWHDNLSSVDLIYPDHFFKPIVRHGLNWISLIILEVIKTDFEKGISAV